MNLHYSPLPALRQKSFREWLDSDQFPTLIEVLTTRAFEREVEAVNSRIECKAGAFPTYEVKAQDAAREADTIHRMISLLENLRKQQTPFNVAVPVPNPTTTT